MIYAVKEEMKEARKMLEEQRIRTGEDIRSDMTREVRSEVVRTGKEETRKRRIVMFGGLIC